MSRRCQFQIGMSAAPPQKALSRATGSERLDQRAQAGANPACILNNVKEQPSAERVARHDLLSRVTAARGVTSSAISLTEVNVRRRKVKFDVTTPKSAPRVRRRV